MARRAVTNENRFENTRLPDIHPALPGKFKRGDKAARKSGLTQRRIGPFGQKAFQYGPVHNDADEPTDALQGLFQRHHWPSGNDVLSGSDRKSTRLHSSNSD